MLSFANPWAFSLLAFLVPVTILYFLRMRFKRQPVGSAFIWRRVMDKNSGGNRLKFRSVLLLCLQIAAVCMAAFSAAGPSIESRRLLKPGVAFVLDSSASMSAESIPGGNAGSRLEEAKRAAAEELKGLPPDTPVMIFAGASSLEKVWYGDSPADGLKALEGIPQEEGAFLEDEAGLALESALAERQGAWRASVYTDGGMDLGGRRLSSAFDGAIEFKNVGGNVDDVGIFGLTLADSGSGGLAGFSLRNGTAETKTRRVSLALDGRELAAADIAIPPGETRSNLAFADRIEDGAYEIRFGSGDDYALNDGCFLAINPERGLSVLYAGKRDPYLEAAMAFRGIDCTTMEYLPEKIDADEWDFAIVNGLEPGAGIACNLAVFGALPPDAPARETKNNVYGKVSAVENGHPLGRFLLWEDGAAGFGKGIEAGPGAETLASVGNAPVMVAWEKNGFRYFACSLDMAMSDFGLSQAFPVLMRNLIQWFAPGSEGRNSLTLRVGEGAWRSEGISFAVDDRRVGVTMSGTRAYVRAEKSGVYGWSAEGRSGFLAANIPESELDPSPRALGQPKDRPSLSAAFRSKSQPIMRLPIAFLLVLLAAEWILWSGWPPMPMKAGNPRRRRGVE